MSERFLARATIYQGDYNCVMRNPDCEFDMGAHYHDFYEVQIYFSDAGIIRIGDNKYSLHRGDVALINIFEPHALYCNSDAQYERFCVSVDPCFLLSVCSNESDLLGIFNKSNKHFPVYHLDEDQFERIQKILHEYEQANLSHGKDILERALLYQLLANLYNFLYDEDCAVSVESQYITVISNLIRFISEHIQEDLSLERLSAEVNFSASHVCRMFKKYTGYTLTKYIIAKRIEKAKFLLKGSTPITDICHEIGFNNYSYFYKTFKKVVGCNPADYREAIEYKENPSACTEDLESERLAI